jgi:hypothetical protein
MSEMLATVLAMAVLVSLIVLRFSVGHRYRLSLSA